MANKQLKVYMVYTLCGDTKMPRVVHHVIYTYLYKLNFVKEQKLKSQIGKSNLHMNLLCPFLEINLKTVFVFIVAVVVIIF